MKNSSRTSIKTVISSVIRDLQLNDVSNIADSMIEWAFEAEMLIGTYNTFERVECELDIKNNRAKLPKDFYKLISLKIGNSFPQYTNRDFRLFYKGIGNATPGIPSNLAQGINDTEWKFSIDNNYIHLSNNSSAEAATLLGISYMAIPLDEHGFPYILHDHVTAVTAYIIWKYKLADYVRGKIPHHVYAELEKRWVWLCGNTRGNDSMPDTKELEYIGYVWQQLLPVYSQNIF